MDTPLDRRTFIKTAALTSTVLLPAALAAQPQDKPATLRIGIVGCGGRGTGAAVQALRADPNTQLVAMGDIFPERLDKSLKDITEAMSNRAEACIKVTDKSKFVGFDAYQKVIDAGIDVVLLTTHPQFRPIHLKAAVAAGKHVFAEKPVAVDATGLRSVLESAAESKRRNLALQVGFCWRYAQAEKATFQKIHDGAIGQVTSVHSTYHTSSLTKHARKPEWSDTEFQIRNWWHFTWVSGDHIVEQAIHSMDRMLWAFDDALPLRCTALGGRAACTGPESGNCFDHFTAIYEFPNNRRGILTCCQIDGTRPTDNSDYINGTGGAAVVNGFSNTHTINATGQPPWKYEGPSTDMYQNEHNNLFASIRAGKPINDGERGAHSTLAAIMGRMAAYTGQAVTWQQALESKEDLSPKKYEFGPLPEAVIAIPGKTKLI